MIFFCIQASVCWRQRQLAAANRAAFDSEQLVSCRRTQPSPLLLLLCSCFLFFFFPLLSTDVLVSFLLLESGNILPTACLPWCCTCSRLLWYHGCSYRSVSSLGRQNGSGRRRRGSDSAGWDSSVSDSRWERFTKSHLANKKKKEREITSRNMEGWRAFPLNSAPRYLYIYLNSIRVRGRISLQVIKRS